jgi:hypothetical protein
MQGQKDVYSAQRQTQVNTTTQRTRRKRHHLVEHGAAGSENLRRWLQCSVIRVNISPLVRVSGGAWTGRFKEGLQPAPQLLGRGSIAEVEHNETLDMRVITAIEKRTGLCIVV